MTDTPRWPRSCSTATTWKGKSPSGGRCCGLEEKMRFPGYVFLGRLGERAAPRFPTGVRGQGGEEPHAPRPGRRRSGGPHGPRSGAGRPAASRTSTVGRLRWTVMSDPEGNEFCVTAPE